MKENLFKRITSGILAGVLVLGYVPATAFAAKEDGLCEHHTQHTKECGYSAALEGHACNHTHTDECYQSVAECIHIHGDCGYVETAAEVLCDHVCSEDSGCVSKELNCQHQHDDACAYAEATAESPCTFACKECAEEVTKNTEAESVEPTKETEQPTIPTTSSQALGTSAVVASGTCGANLTWELDEAGVLTISGNGPMDDYGNSVNSPWHYRSEIVRVSITEGVTSIGDKAFYGCNSLHCITIPDSVTSIGMYAFHACYGLSSITIPDSVTSIGEGAFFQCFSLGSIVIPDGITDIGMYTFTWCSSLSSVTIPEGVTSIGEMAFYLCSRLSRIVIPNSVTNIGNNAFNSCDSLNEIWFTGDAPVFGQHAFGSVTATAYYPANNETWTSDIMQNYGGTITWVAVENEDHEHSYTAVVTEPTCIAAGYTTYTCTCSDQYIADEVESDPNAHVFGEWTTESNRTYRVCTLCGYTESKITTGGGDVEIELPEQPGDIDIDVSPIEPSDSKYVLVQEVLTEEPDKDVQVLKVFDINLKNENGIHVQPDGTAKVKLPLDWDKDGNYKVYRINDDGTKTDMNAVRQGSHMVFETDHFSLYVIVEESEVTPDIVASGTCGSNQKWELDEMGVLTISGSGPMDDYGSYNNPSPWKGFRSDIISVVIADGVTCIGDRAFYECTCLTSIAIPASVTSIGASAFSDCSSLTSITIPASVTSIGASAFSDCSSLTSITIPASVTNIENHAFRNCGALTGIWVDSANTQYSSDASGCLFDYNKTTLMQAPGKLSGSYTVPDGVTTIGKRAFSGTDVGQIVLPATLVSVGEYAFVEYTLKTIVFNGDVPTVEGYGENPTVFFKSHDETDSISVLYPASNASWTAEARQKLNPEGANILWVSFDTAGKPSGSCGATLQWQVEEATGKLSISGTGVMDSWDWETSFSPWISYGGCIKTVEIGAGVTTISDSAFRNTAVESIHFLGNPPTSIGKDVLESYERTAYYPSGNAAWETVKQQYPVVTWIAEGSAFDGLHDIVANCETMTAEEIRAAVQALNQEELLKSLQSGEAYNDYSMLAYQIQTIYPKLVITTAVPDLISCMSSPMCWSMVGASFNNLIDPENQVTLMLDKPRNATAIPEGYNKDKAIPFSLSLSNIQSPEHLLVPIYIDFILPDSINPLLVDVFRRNLDTGIMEKIPSYSYWTKRGMVLSFVITGTGDYLIVPKTNATASGICGDNLTWTYSEDKTLTISGSGSMYDYGRTSNPAPWAYYREHVEHIVIGENVTSIGSYAFFGSRFTNRVTIPASVQTIGSGAFYGFFDLSLIFEGDCPNVQSDTLAAVRGQLYYHPEKPGWNAVAGERKWCGADDLTWLPIVTSGSCGENLTWTFAEATGILTIRGTGAMFDFSPFEEELTPWALYSDKITKIVLENGVTTIGAFTFYDCYNVTAIEIPNSVTAIYASSINPSHLKELSIPASVTTLDVSSGIAGVEQIDMAEDNPVYTVEDNVLFTKDKSALLLVARPEIRTYCIPEGVTRIGESAFGNCGNLQSVTFASSVAHIEGWAFMGCNSLSTLKFQGNAPSLGENAFDRHHHVAAYYPVGNSTWTEAVRQNYGDNFTWKVYCTGEHSWGTVVITREPTETITGIHTYTCTVCGAIKSETINKVNASGGNVELEILNQTEENLSVDVEFVEEISDRRYIWVQEVVAKDQNENVQILKVFDINLNNEDNAHVQPNGTIKVKLPLDWDKEGNYKVYRINDDNTKTDMNAVQQGSHMVFETDHFSIYVIVGEKAEKRLNLTGSDLAEGSAVWIDGIAYPVLTADDGSAYVQLPENAPPVIVTYSYYNGSGGDPHTQYPTGMQVYRIRRTATGATAERIPELDNLLQYSGCSIRITGNKGIRMITSVNQDKRNALTGNGLANFKLLEYGTLLAQTSKLGSNPLVLGGANVKSNYAYKKGVADPVFKYANGLIQYTNVLVGFTDAQCAEDIAMRPYMKLLDENGEEFVIYGGIVYRSIGYIAYQNRNAFQPGSAAYEYVWSIIHNVYGTKYDADYKK